MSNPVYRGFGARQFPPGFFDRAVFNMDVVRQLGLDPIFEPINAGARQPFKGITTDREVIRGLYPIRETGISPAPIVAAAKTFLEGLSIVDRSKVRHRLGDPSQRLWTNAFIAFPPHGILLEDADEATRARVCEVLKSSFSVRGFSDVRTFMKFNGYLGQLVGDPRNLAEWLYYFTLFNEPSETEPWGWQLMGHHINVSCFIMGGQMVMTPLFLGAEPNISDATEGPYAGMRILQEEQQLGLEFVQALNAQQQSQAILYRSMNPEGGLPAYLNSPADGRMRAVTGADNLVLAYEGVSAENLDAGQRRRLLTLMEQYVGRLAAGHNELKMEEVEAHLEQTHFAWIGDPDSSNAPFYYKIHSPVVLIEFDHHPGVLLDNEHPERFHAHTIVRTPNGGDYGIDLLRQHYDRFLHTEDGRHVARPVGLSVPDQVAEHERAHAEGRAHSHPHGHSHGDDH